MSALRHCVECGGETPNVSLICARCEPLYRTEPMIDDACDCPSCRSDMAGLVPCRAPAAPDAATGGA